MFDKLELVNIGCTLGTTHIFGQISLTITQGQRVVIAGKSGSGKSTLLEICAGIRKPTTGEVLYDNNNIANIPYRTLLSMRNRVGFAFQQHALIHNYPLYDNLALPLRYHTHATEKEIRAQVEQMLGKFNLVDQMFKLPEALAVGQAKCASVARALIMDPAVLFLDEPTSSLDPFTAALIVENLNAFCKSGAKTLIVVSHNTFLMKELKCIIKILDNGSIHDFNTSQPSHDTLTIDSYLRNLL